jgi:hypothetical protein
VEIGKVVRICPDWFSMDDPEADAIVYNFANVYLKGEWFYSFQHPDANKTNVFATRDNKCAQELRRKFAPTYAAFLSYEGLVEECVSLRRRAPKVIATLVM